MHVKEAVEAAKTYLMDLLAEEGLINLGLEEVEFDDDENVWLVTLGFSRPWNTTKGPLATIGGESPAKRAYRVVKIDNRTKMVLSVKRSADLVFG